ncbi:MULTISPECIES: DNA-binding protein [Peribacillus]|uniref:DNA-binding protein n=1 Tax=Peribacillus TaxID=2675229 RepID=UPI001070D04A|nr:MULTISPECIES: DNA-binding protein [Peribacillus]MDV7763998.1 DNA-binding protein [Peribacillus sp. CSMR9]TFH61196.1 DNA-binding protein [Peribacillus frigoritolerans]
MRIYNVHQAIKILQEYYITDSIQMVTRWIRDGKIRAERSDNRKEGWKIHHVDLFDFIDEQRPGLPEVMAVHEWYVENAFRLDDQKSEEEEKPEFNLPVDEIIQAPSIEHEGEIQQLEEKIDGLTNQLHLANQKKYELTKEIDKLKEEYNFLEELYEQVEETCKETAIELVKVKSEITHSKKEQAPSTIDGSLIKTVSFQDFKSIYNEISKECSNDVIEFIRKSEDIPKSIYSAFFNKEEKLEENIIEGIQYRCPLTDKKYKNFKPMLKNAIREKLRIIQVEVKVKKETGESNV